MAKELRPDRTSPFRRKPAEPVKFAARKLPSGGWSYQVVSGDPDPYAIALAIRRLQKRDGSETRATRNARLKTKMATALLQRKQRLVEAQQRGI